MIESPSVTIKSDIPEDIFIENLLNMKYSGVSERYILPCISFYAMANSWDIGKLFYYLKLIGILK